MAGSATKEEASNHASFRSASLLVGFFARDRVLSGAENLGRNMTS